MLWEKHCITDINLWYVWMGTMLFKCLYLWVGLNAQNTYYDLQLFVSIFFNVKSVQNLFKRKRLEQNEAVKSIMKFDSVKQYKLIDTIASKAFQVLQESQIKLREAGYVPGMDFPSESNVRDALSLCLENTAFMSEILLHMPDVTHRLLNMDKSRSLILTWGIFFASQSTFLDKHTKKLIYLASQELKMSEPDPNYVNPYARTKEGTNPELETPKKKERKKKTFQKGPRLSSQLGEL